MTSEEIKALEKGTVLVLTKSHTTAGKQYPEGTSVVYDRLQAIAAGDRAFVFAGTDRPFPIPPAALALPGGAQAPEATEDDGLSGPVVDFMGAHAHSVDDPFVINFVMAYAEAVGLEDVAMLGDMAAQAEVGVGGRWTKQQTAAVAEAFYNTFGYDVDPLATAALAPDAPPPPPKAAPAPKPAPTAAATATPAAKPAAVQPKVPAASKPVGSEALVERLDARHLGALRIMAALTPLFIEAPQHFDAELSAALVLLKRCTRALD